LSDSESIIPLGYCQCGCGAKTTLVTRNIPKRGLKKGEPSRFIIGHALKAHFRDMPDPNPSGLCMCGCGKSTPIAKRSDASTGMVAGKCLRFVAHHRTRHEIQRKQKPAPKSLQLDACACGCGGMVHGKWLNGHWGTAKTKARTVDGTQQCHVCGENKPATDEWFVKSKQGPVGFRTICKVCHARQVAEVNKRWRETHQQELRDASNHWKHTHEVHRKAQAHRRRSRAKGPGFGAAEVEAQYARQEGRCFYCGKRVGQKYHVDHVMPLALDGPNSPENIVIACPFCNTSKGAKHPMDFCGRLL
jgi:hypothetical protein